MSRSALPLPRYVLRKPLGTDYETAVRRAETVLLPAFDSWRSGGLDVAFDFLWFVPSPRPHFSLHRSSLCAVPSSTFMMRVNKERAASVSAS
jgi:hypothetical protein